MTRFATYYMDNALFGLPKVIDRAVKDLDCVDFDTLVGTGFSGGIVIPALALAMGKQFVLIRKETDDSHHGRGRLLGQLGEKWVFVDDFVASGKTRKRVIEKVSEAAVDTDNFNTKMVGQYMYVNYGPTGPYFEDFRSEWAETLW